MRRFLQRTHANLGPVPRRLNASGFEVPFWLADDHLLTPVLRGAAELLSHGTLRWGCIVQANRRLFQPGADNAPAVILVGLDDASDHDPGALHYAAQECVALRSLDADEAAALPPAQAHIRDALEAEAEAFNGIAVPDALNHGQRCAMYWVFVQRAHLPKPYLARHLVPVVVGERPEQGVVIVPSRWWAKELTEVWP